MRFGIWELVIVLFIVILIFGANRLPELGKGVVDGVKGSHTAPWLRPSLRSFRLHAERR